MAKTNGPLLSLSAHGSVGTELTFSKRRSGNQVRFQKKQKGLSTTAREIQRGYFAEANEHWLELNAGEQGQWHAFNNN